jgi:hypothetical protein
MIRPTLAVTAVSVIAFSLCCHGSSTPIDKSNPQPYPLAADAGVRVSIEDSHAMPTSSTCDPTLDSLLRRDLASLPGLPADCTLGALGARIEIDGSDRRGLLGQARHPSIYRGARAAGYDETVEVWHRDQIVLKLVVDLPQLADAPALIAALGEPDARLDYYPSTVPTLRQGGAWVYAARGLTLFISRDGTNVVRFEVYPPTSAAAYERDLFYSEPPRERP